MTGLSFMNLMILNHFDQHLLLPCVSFGVECASTPPHVDQHHPRSSQQRSSSNQPSTSSTMSDTRLNMRPNPKQLVEYFSRSLTAFQSSQDAMRILCTLPHRSNKPSARAPSRPVQKLVVLDSSFNPPTAAHAQMATSALRHYAKIESGGGKQSTRLMLLLAVNNADKAPQPASFPVRLAMMDAFGGQILHELQGSGGYSNTGKCGDGRDDLELDLAVTTLPYFHDKSRVVAEMGIYGPSEPEHVFLAGFDTVIRIFNPKYYTNRDPQPSTQASPSAGPMEGETTPGMQECLGPFFDRAILRVTMRPDDEWGSRDEQTAYVKGLQGGELDRVGGESAWARRVEMVEGGAGGISSSKVRSMVKGGEGGELDKLVSGDVKRWIEVEGLYKE